MPTIDTIRRLTVQGQSVGLDKVQADLKAVSAGQDQVTQSSARLVSATSATEKSVLSAQGKLDNYTKAMDPLTKALANLERGQRAVAQVQAQGGTVSDANNRALANATARVEELRQATERHTAAVGFNRNQMLEATHVAKSLFDEIAAGVPITRALTVEGGRIAQIFAEGSGGVTGTLTAAGAAVGALVSPFAVAATGAIAFGAAALYAKSSYDSMQDSLRKSLSGVGHATGLSTEGLNDLAKGSAAQTGVGIGDSRANAETLAQTGKLSSDNISGVLGLTRGYAGAFGTSYSEAGSKLADIFADPAKGAETLNERLGFLDAGTKRYIDSLKAQGDQQGAINALIRATTPALNEQVEKVGLLDRAWQRIKDNNERYTEIIGKAMSAPTPMETYRGASQSRNFIGAYATMLGRGLVDDGSSNAAEDIRNAARLRQQQQASVLAAQQSSIAVDAIKSAVPEMDQRQDLIDRQKALQNAVGNPDTMRALGDAAQYAQQALNRTTTALSTLTSAADQIKRDSALTVASIQAETFAGRQAIEYQKNYADTLRGTHNALQAAATAEAKRNEAIATANKQAEDAARQQRDQDALLGLKPAQRLAAERDQSIANAGRNFGGNFAQPTVGNADMVAFADAIKSVESSGGDYGALGPVTKTGDRAYGAYQVMGSNIPAWTKDALGSSLSPDQFLASKDAQDAVFSKRFGGSLSRYGNASDAASVWFTGRPLSQGAGATDALGTSGAGYVGKFNAALGGSSVSPSAYGTSTDAANDHYGKQYAYLQKAPLDEATDALNRQTAAFNLQKTSVGASAEAIATMNERQNLLNQYQASGVKVTDDLMANINAEAAAYGALAKQQDEFAKQQQKVIGAMDGIRGASRDALGTFVSDLRNGQSAGKALQDVMAGLETKLLNLAEDQAIKGLFGTTGTANGGALGGALSSMLGSLFGGSSAAAATGAATSAAGSVGTDAAVLGMLYHSGGIVGSNDNAAGKMLPMSAWAGAPRHHSGYGLASDERPAILQTGEAVVSRADLAAARAAKNQSQAAAGSGATSSGDKINVQVVHNGSSDPTVNYSKGPDGAHIFQVMWDQAAAHSAMNNGKGYRAMASRAGFGRTGG